MSASLVIEDITSILAGQKTDSRFAPAPEYKGHEQIVFASDPSINFRAFIAIHNTNRGPALGGCRYRSDYTDDADALADVLRLSRGMTYKNATAGLDLGGGKGVIMGPKGQDKPTPEMMSALGRVVESLGGRYVTAEDMNTTEADMERVFSQTRYVTGIAFDAFRNDLPAGFDLSSLPGANPSPYTAYGTFMGIKACIAHRSGSDRLDGVRVAVKGAAGAVAADLCRMLYREGAALIMSDWDENTAAQARLRQISAECDGAKIVSSAVIMAEDADIFAPCARGGDINDASLPVLKAKIVAGCANNVLAQPRHADVLKQAGVLYAPDYVINAGGVICVGTQYLWRAHPDRYPVPTHQEIMSRTAHIYDVLLDIFARADREGGNTASIADLIGEERFAMRAKAPAAA